MTPAQNEDSTDEAGLTSRSDRPSPSPDRIVDSQSARKSSEEDKAAVGQRCPLHDEGANAKRKRSFHLSEDNAPEAGHPNDQVIQGSFEFDGLSDPESEQVTQ